MSKANLIFFGILGAWLGVSTASAAGLDEIYRDLVRSDNRGYLPLFVKNRQAPNVLEEDVSFSETVKSETFSPQDLQGLEEINLENDRQRRNAEIEAANLRWQQVLRNVQNGYVSSFELDELNRREQAGDTHAVEVLAWIYSRGVGVKPDLLKAFHLYKKAVDLNVSGAMDNAVKVYRAMTSAQKSILNQQIQDTSGQDDAF